MTDRDEYNLMDAPVRYTMAEAIAWSNGANMAQQACSAHYQQRIKELEPSKQALDCISIMLANEMNACVKNGDNSVSMPDNLVAVAGWLSSVEQAITDKG